MEVLTREVSGVLYDDAICIILTIYSPYLV